MLPFEFIVEGPPLSHQTASRRRLAAWRNKVRAAAQVRWKQSAIPAAERLQIVIVYYHDGESVRMDNDNLMKPIQDALNGLVYEDDRQVTDARVRKTSLDGAFRVRGISATLAIGFSRGVEFLHIRVDSAPDHEELL